MSITRAYQSLLRKLACYLHFDGNLHRQQIEKGGELDDRVQGNGRSVLEGVSYGVAHNGCLMEGCVFFLQVNLRMR